MRKRTILVRFDIVLYFYWIVYIDILLLYSIVFLVFFTSFLLFILFVLLVLFFFLLLLYTAILGRLTVYFTGLNCIIFLQHTFLQILPQIRHCFIFIVKHLTTLALYQYIVIQLQINSDVVIIIIANRKISHYFVDIFLSLRLPLNSLKSICRHVHELHIKRKDIGESICEHHHSSRILKYIKPSNKKYDKNQQIKEKW